MQFIQQLLSENMITALGWTLVHALWQGVLTAILLGVLLVLMYRFSSKTRYFITIFAMSFFLLMTAVTFTILYRPQEQPVAERVAEAMPGEVLTAPAAPAATEKLPVPLKRIQDETNERLASVQSLLAGIREYFKRHMPLIVTGWLMGVALLFLKFLGGLAYLQRIKNYKTGPMSDRWTNAASELCRKLHIVRPVRYLTSRIITTPMTAGFLKPVIILPARLLTGLSAKQIEGILLHELAHIRRNDYLVNILQSIVEILFFYHPAVWWMSARVRDERENCCDDIAIAISGETTGYARALISVQEAAIGGPVPALGFAGTGQSQFAQRIRRIFNQPTLFADFREGFITAMILVGGFCALAFGTPDYNPATGRSSAAEDAAPQALTEASTRTERQRKPPVPLQETLPPADPATAASLVSHQTGDEDLKLLLNAISEGNYEMVVFMIDKGVDINAGTNSGWTPLMEAADAGEYEIAELLLEKGAEINALSEAGITPLMIAASEGETELVRLLLSRGADKDVKTRNGATAFFHAVGEGQEETVKLFIAEGADVNDLSYHLTPLMLAITEGEHDLIRLLLDRGADVNLKHPRNQLTAIQVAADEGDTGIIQLLVERGAPFDFDSDDSQYALLEAVEEDNFEMIKYLLDRGMDINTSWKGMTPLARASGEGNYEMVEFLIANRADVTSANPEAEVTPLLAAAEEGHTNIVRLLLGKGADINATDLNGRTALMLAAEEEQTEVVKFLLNNGATVDHRDKNGRTALAQAIAGNALETAEILIDAGADPEEQSDQLPYLVEAADNGHLQMTKFLLDQGVPPDQASGSGHTALMEAADEGHLELARLLIRSGAQVNVANENGRTALFDAAGEGHLEIAGLLIENGADVNALSAANWMNVDRGNMTSYSVRNWTPLCEAIEEEEPALVRLLIDNGADINHRVIRISFDLEKEIEDRELTRGWTPLMQAISEQNEEIVTMLLKNGADVNAKTEDGTGTIEIAKKTQNQEILQIISSWMKR